MAWPLLFVHGTSGKLRADTAVTAQLADELRLPVEDSTLAATPIATPDT